MFFRHRFARTCFRCSRPRRCWPPPRTTSRPATRSIGAGQPDQLLHRAGAQQPRQRHQQSARRHRQRRAGAAGRQHRHHLAAEPGRQRPVGRQPGAADPGRLFDQVQRDDRRRSAGANANNLLGTGAGYTDATVHRRDRRPAPSPRPSPTRRPPAPPRSTTTTDGGRPSRAATLLVGTASAPSNDLGTALTNGSTLVVNGTTITFSTATTTRPVRPLPASPSASAPAAPATVGDILDRRSMPSPDRHRLVGHRRRRSCCQTGTTANLSITGSANALPHSASARGVDPGPRRRRHSTAAARAGTTLLSGTTAEQRGALSAAFAAGDTLNGRRHDADLRDRRSRRQPDQHHRHRRQTCSRQSIPPAATPAPAPSPRRFRGGVITLHTGTANGSLSITSSNAAALDALGLGSSVYPGRRRQRTALGRANTDHRRHRQRYADQHHLRHRHRSDLDAEPAQRRVGGQQSAGDHQHDRRHHHHDEQQRGFGDDRRDQRHRCRGGRCLPRPGRRPSRSPIRTRRPPAPA